MSVFYRGFLQAVQQVMVLALKRWGGRFYHQGLSCFLRGLERHKVKTDKDKKKKKKKLQCKWAGSDSEQKLSQATTSSSVMWWRVGKALSQNADL